MPILAVVCILVGLIVIHELGHFIAAKLFGIDVEEFGVGYPPRAMSLGKIAETEYTLNWLPFGGFVRLSGEDDSDDKGGKPGKRSFHGAARWKQIIVLVAGVVMNAVAAWVLFALALHSGMLAVVDNIPMPNAHLVVSEVIAESPAAISGIKVGDEILSIVDAKGAEPEQNLPNEVVTYVRAHPGSELTVKYLRQGVISEVRMSPVQAIIEGSPASPALGVALAEVAPVHLPLFEAFAQAGDYTKGAFKSTFAGLVSLLKGAIRGTPDISQVVGPVGLVSVVADAENHGLGYLLELAAVIAVNLAIINLVPLPALDGGRIVVVSIEAIIRRPIPKFIVDIVNMLGFLLIILFMGVVTYHDIMHLFR